MAKTIEAAAVHEFGKPVKFEEGRPADDQTLLLAVRTRDLPLHVFAGIWYPLLAELGSPR